MTYEEKKFEHLIGLKGFSHKILNSHFKIYQNHVININKILKLLNKKIDVYEYGELKRRFGWEFNGMRLHELYFENINVDHSIYFKYSMNYEYAEIDKRSNLYRKIVQDFGSFEKWKDDFKSSGLIKGVGWVILVYDKDSDKMFNIFINENNLGYLEGSIPLLVMDVFEHSFMIDYGLKKADYINAFFKVIDWRSVLDRYD